MKTKPTPIEATLMWRHTEASRRAFVKDKLRRRYLALLRMPNWSTAELDQLGPGMRRDIEGALAHRGEIRARLAWRPGITPRLTPYRRRSVRPADCR
jgi:hypothetical protein